MNSMYWLNQSSSKTGQKSVFSEFDENQDGMLDSTELSKFAADLSEKSGQTVDTSSLTSLLDTNQDGVISEDELNAGRDKVMAQYGPPKPEGIYGPPKPEEIYNKLDVNQDGSLDESEISSFADELSKRTGTTVDGKTLLSALDSDENGVISESEFKSGREKVEELFGMPKPPDMEDSNSTGTVSTTGNTINDTFSNYILSMLGNNTDGNSAESTTSYQSLATVLLSSYTTNSSSLSGIQSLLNISA